MVSEKKSREEELLVTRPSRLYYINRYLFMAFFLVLGILSIIFGPQFISEYGIKLPELVFYSPFLLTPFPIIWAEVSRLRTRYHLTDQKVVEERGIFSKEFESITYSQITDTTLQVSFGERFFKIGDIAISTAGSSNYAVILSGVRRPHEFQDIIEKQRQEGVRLSKESIKQLAEEISESSGRVFEEMNELRREIEEIEREKESLREKLDRYDITEQEFDRRIDELNREEEEMEGRLEELEEKVRGEL